MPGATLTTVASILKEVYEGKIQDQLNEETVAAKRLERSSEGVVDTVGGKYVTFPVRIQRNAGISYRGESGQLAAAGNQGYAAVQVPLRYGYGRFRMTAQTLELAESNFQAFAAALDEEQTRLKDDLAKDCNRIIYGNKNGIGVIAKITDTTTSATHAVDNVGLLEVGMVVDVLVISSGSATGGGSSLTINSIDEVNSTVTFSASIGATTTGHGIYRAGNRGLEPTGLRNIVLDSAALHNIDPATTPVWKANAIYNTGARGTPVALTEANMIKGCDLARRKGGKISAIFTSLGVRRSYFNILTQQRRYTDTKAFPGGFQALPFNYGTEIPIVEDPDAPLNTMIMLDESKVKIFRNKPWHYANEDGNILKWVYDYDVWEGFMRQFWEVGTSQRNAHTIYEDITES